MSIQGYVRKGKPALWLSTFPSQSRSVAAVAPKRARDRVASKRPKANWTTVPGAVVAEVAERKRVRRQSKIGGTAERAHAKQSAERLAADIAAGMTCPVYDCVLELQEGYRYGHPVSNVLRCRHHWAGRGHGGRGPLLMDERLKISMSTLGHRWVQAHPAEARALGFFAPLGQWNVPVPLDATVTRLPGGGLRVEDAT